MYLYTCNQRLRIKAIQLQCSNLNVPLNFLIEAIITVISIVPKVNFEFLFDLNAILLKISLSFPTFKDNYDSDMSVWLR